MAFKKYDSSYKRTESPFTPFRKDKNLKYSTNLAKFNQSKEKSKKYKKIKAKGGINVMEGAGIQPLPLTSPALEYIGGGAAKLLRGGAKVAYELFKGTKAAKLTDKVRQKFKRKK
tara:strand:- start:350 stop:694 length:345 start_codon:yes stop_codon:yes gene_type:complete